MSCINDQWQADLVDVSSLASSNDNHTFILTVIDVFSKVGYTQPLRNKEGHSITNAFKSILSTMVIRNHCRYKLTRERNFVINTSRLGLMIKE